MALADPDTGLAWDAPFFQILALSYQPNKWIAVWPREQRLTTPREKFTIRAEDMRAATQAMGEVTGRTGVEDMLDIIFAEFCIGK